MTKLLVEINGNFSLLDYFGGKQHKTSKKDASAEDIKSAGIKNFLKDYDINAKDENPNGSRNNGNQQ